jgi:hypothetical protein
LLDSVLLYDVEGYLFLSRLVVGDSGEYTAATSMICPVVVLFELSVPTRRPIIGFFFKVRIE